MRAKRGLSREAAAEARSKGTSEIRPMLIGRELFNETK
jgi:hypothetical protein